MDLTSVSYRLGVELRRSVVVDASRSGARILCKFDRTALPLEASDEDALESHSISDVAEAEKDDAFLPLLVKLT